MDQLGVVRHPTAAREQGWEPPALRELRSTRRGAWVLLWTVSIAGAIHVFLFGVLLLALDDLAFQMFP